eukprot:12429093-Karenia_brevis.AAC.1
MVLVNARLPSRAGPNEYENAFQSIEEMVLAMGVNYSGIIFQATCIVIYSTYAQVTWVNLA